MMHDNMEKEEISTQRKDLFHKKEKIHKVMVPEIAWGDTTIYVETTC